MTVKSKADSNYLINKLGLNRVEYRIFNVTSNVKDEITKYMLEKGTEKTLWNIRDNTNYSGRFMQGVSVRDLDNIDFSNTDSIKVSESMVVYDLSNLVAQGDVWVDREYNVRATISTKTGYTLREATSKAELFDTVVYNFVQEKCPAKHREVVENIVDMMCNLGLLGCVVEFTTYSVNVGTNNENTVIWEIRSR